MNFLYEKDNHFNIANIVTYLNISCGIFAIYFLTHNNFLISAIFAWSAGIFDIFDGKIARKYNLCTQFGVQLDSFADFLSFVIVPCMFIYFSIIESQSENINLILIAAIFIYYVISALRRLISFNIDNSKENINIKYFVGVPTPLGAILLWLLYLIYLTNILNIYVVLIAIIYIAYLLNSKLKIPHL